MINIGCGLGGIALVIFFIIKIREMARAQAERKRIWKEGRPATAKVVKIVGSAATISRRWIWSSTSPAARR
jgi:hypothetical protein